MLGELRPPGELVRVGWGELGHAYGRAEDVPGLIRALYSGDREAFDAAEYELYGTIHHQGTVYPATVAAVPFLAHAALHGPWRAEVLLMLVVLADQPHPRSAVAEEVCAAVGRCVPELLPCLAAPERLVRQAAVRLAAVAARPAPEAVARRLAELCDTDPVAEVRADALTALACLAGGAGATEPDTEREAAALAGDVPALRLAAALLALERSGPPFPEPHVEILATDGADPDPDAGHDPPFARLGDREQRLRRLLTADPDAGLAVAARWVADGDPGDRGARLADEIAATWRDREAEVVTVLAAALPGLERDPKALAARLAGIARWAAAVREPGARLRDALAGYASHAEPAVSEAAWLALARCGDERALARLRAVPVDAGPPPFRVLAALASHDAALPHLRPALRAADAHGAAPLLAALTPGTAARLRPELRELLRTGRSPVLTARLLAGDPAAAGLLAEAATGAREETARAASAVSHALLTGDPGLALRVLGPLLAGERRQGILPEATRLGPLGAPLLPAIEDVLHAPPGWTRMLAAEAHWRIGGDPGPAVPVLTELLSTAPVGVRAVEVLAEMGHAPDELRPYLRHFAWSPLRLTDPAPPGDPTHPDDRLRTAALRLLG